MKGTMSSPLPSQRPSQRPALLRHPVADHHVPGSLDRGFSDHEPDASPMFPRIDDIHSIAHRARNAGSLDEALALLPAAVARIGGFARVVVSQIVGSHWEPRWEQSALGDSLEPSLAGRRFAFVSGQAETDLARRRSGVLLERGDSDPRRRSPLVDHTGMTSFVVASIVVEDEPVALLHADHGAGRHPVVDADADILDLIVGFVGIALETQKIAVRIESERTRVRHAFDDATAVFVRDLDEAMAPAAVVHRQPAVTGNPWGVSSREEDVMHLILQGLTNRQIAERLFLSESTVKSHIKRIFRKLDASSRAEVIVRVRGRGERRDPGSP
ncbi:LuxR C-terminal-related transcriptional regulator [soil metagenome]